MSEWIKINTYHRPAIGHAVFSTFDPKEGHGTIFLITEIHEDGFTMQSVSNEKGIIPNDEKQILFVPHNLISITNLWVWDRHRENNYEIDEIYSN